MARDHLRIRGMIFHAYHGCEPDERSNGQRFEVDVDLVFNAAPAAVSDRLKDTIDVRKVYQQVDDVVTNDHFALIETLGAHIAQRMLAHFSIEEVTVAVRKPFAPIGGLANGSEIEITRRRE